MSALPIYIAKEPRDRMWAYILSMKEEVGGFGFATRDTAGDIVIHDIFLVDQVVTAGSVDFTDLGIQQAIERAGRSGFFEDPDGIWVWWHSHNSMGVYWSTTDEGGVEALRETGVPYMISIVGNHKMESKARIDVFNVPIIGHATFNDCALRRYTKEPFQEAINHELLTYVEVDRRVWAKGGKQLPASTAKVDEKGKQKQLPAGTRDSDPGKKLDDALNKGYAEYTRAELEGKSPDEQAWQDSIDVDLDGAAFDWDDVVGFITNEAEAKSWEDMGGKVVKYRDGEWLLMESGPLEVHAK